MNELSRINNLLNKIIIIDGMSATGKIVVDDFLSKFHQMEILNFSAELESITIIKHLNKINFDAFNSFVKIHLDLLLYNTLMSRSVNFRLTDQSGVLKSQKFFKYFFRLFSKGNAEIPSIIDNNKPCLRLMTHSILAFSKPLFEVLQNKLFFIDVRRHPLMTLKTIYEQNRRLSLLNLIENKF